MAIDTAFLSPRFVGQKVGLHPVWMIFALFVFSYLFGLVGTLVAVPLAAAIGVLVRFAVQALPRQLRLQGQRAGSGAGGAADDHKEPAMTAAPDQLILDLAHRPALEAEDFLISRSNQAAADIVDRWPDWPHACVVVVGPAARRQDASGQRLAPEVGRGPARGRAPLARPTWSAPQVRCWWRTCTPASATSAPCSTC